MGGNHSSSSAGGAGGGQSEGPTRNASILGGGPSGGTNTAGGARYQRTSPRASMGGSTNRPELSRTGVIKNLVNLKRGSLHYDNPTGTISFVFDAAVKTRFRVYFQAFEDLSSRKFPVISTKMDIIESGEFRPGLDLEYSFIVPFGSSVSGWSYDESNTPSNFPVIVETVPESLDSENEPIACQLTYLSINGGEELAGKSHRVSLVKQKLRFGDRGYELHEIFGIEKHSDKSPMSVKSNRAPSEIGNVEYNEEDINGTDCVICLSEPRDTTVLPCRHLCLCSRCAEVLRINSRRCPICRQPVSSMLQIDRDIPVSPLPTSPFRSLHIPE